MLCLQKYLPEILTGLAVAVTVYNLWSLFSLVRYIEARKSRLEECICAMENWIQCNSLAVKEDTLMLTNSQTLLEKSRQLLGKIQLKFSSEHEWWKEPIHLVFADGGWSFQWNKYIWLSDVKEEVRYELVVTPPPHMYVFLNKIYEKLSFCQSGDNQNLFSCYYGSDLIGTWTRRGGKMRHCSRVLKEVLMPPDTMLIDLQKLAEVSKERYSLEEFDRFCAWHAKFGQCGYLRHQATIEYERGLLQQGKRLPENQLSMFINQVFKMYIYHVLSKSVSFLYPEEIIRAYVGCKPK